MLFLTIIKVSLKSLMANKLRSFLAMLGIIIGVGAVISMLAIGTGAKKSIMERISSMGTNLLSIRSRQFREGGVMSDTRKTLTVEDAKAILEINSVFKVSPTVFGSTQLKYFNNNTRSRVVGVAVTYFSIRNFDIMFGSYFTDAEVDRMARVVVLGSEVANNLLGLASTIDLSEEELKKSLQITKNLIGEYVKIKGINFKVVGILKSKGGAGFFNPDEEAFVPYTTAMKILLGRDNIENIDIEIMPGKNMAKVADEISQLLRKRHKILNPEDDDFRVFNQEEIIQTATDITKTFTFLLGGIATISLLVGGIGIMNIMLVTVTERTKEIGIRKAIGAKDSDILKQFLIESLIMTGLGGLIGVIVGISTSVLIARWSTHFTTYIATSNVILAFSFAVAVGVFFGYYPAYRAAQLNPIECLYYE